MLVENVLKCTWSEVPLDTWKEAFDGDNYITKKEALQFAELQFYKAAEKLNMKYDTVKYLFYGKNIKFYQIIEKEFADEDDADDDRYRSYHQFLNKGAELLVPDICTEQCTATNVFLDAFKSLDLKDKAQVLKMFQKVDVKADRQNYDGVALDFIDDFNNKSMWTKCDVVEGILTSDFVFGE